MPSNIINKWFRFGIMTIALFVVLVSLLFLTALTFYIWVVLEAPVFILSNHFVKNIQMGWKIRWKVKSPQLLFISHISRNHHRSNLSLTISWYGFITYLSDTSCRTFSRSSYIQWIFGHPDLSSSFNISYYFLVWIQVFYHNLCT